MVDAYIQALLDAPIDTAARANKVWLPEGKRKAPRPPKPEYHGEELPALKPSEVLERRAKAADRKLGELMDYYATTAIPFETVAAHLKLKLHEVERAMKSRGRAT